MSKIFMAFAISVISIFAAGCGSDSGGNATIAATQSAIQTEIYSKSCTISGSCHDAEKGDHQLDLTAGNSRAETIGVVSQLSTLPLIDPGNPDGSFMVKKVEGDLGNSEGDFMPQGGPKLSDGKIQALRDWIAAGAPDN